MEDGVRMTGARILKRDGQGYKSAEKANLSSSLRCTSTWRGIWVGGCFIPQEEGEGEQEDSTRTITNDL